MYSIHKLLHLLGHMTAKLTPDVQIYTCYKIYVAAYHWDLIYDVIRVAHFLVFQNYKESNLLLSLNYNLYSISAC